jgi:hypothetical protein
VDKRDREFASVFISGLSPSFMARDEDEKQFKQLLDSANKDKNYFILFLKQQLEVIDTIRRSKELVAKASTD